MDLSALDPAPLAEEGAALHLRHPVTDEPLIDEESGEPVTITLLGSDSQTYQKAMHQQQNRRLERSGRQGRISITAEQLESDAVEVLALCTKGWKHIQLRGERLECTPHNARRLYASLQWVREQADAFITKRSNFLGN